MTDKLKFVERFLGTAKLARNSRNVEVRCPICDPKDPSKKKLAILLDDWKVHCWVCGFKARSLVSLIRRFGTADLMHEYVQRFMPALTLSGSDLDASTYKTVQLPTDFKLIALPSGDPDVVALRRYCVSRGLTERDMWYFKLGCSDEHRWKRRVIVPSFDGNGKLSYFVARAIDDRRKPKYDNPDVDRTMVIFNEINVDWRQRLVLCEGTFDMFKCGENVVPLLGSDMNEEYAVFNAIVANATPVALALDADMWNTKTPRLAKRLAQYDIDVSIVDVRGFGDPGKADKDEFQEALLRARPFTWEGSFANKLERASSTTLRVR